MTPSLNECFDVPSGIAGTPRLLQVPLSATAPVGNGGPHVGPGHRAPHVPHHQGGGCRHPGAHAQR